MSAVSPGTLGTIKVAASVIKAQLETIEAHEKRIEELELLLKLALGKIELLEEK